MHDWLGAGLDVSILSRRQKRPKRTNNKFLPGEMPNYAYIHTYTQRHTAYPDGFTAPELARLMSGSYFLSYKHLKTPPLLRRLPCSAFDEKITQQQMRPSMHIYIYIYTYNARTDTTATARLHTAVQQYSLVKKSTGTRQNTTTPRKMAKRVVTRRPPTNNNNNYGDGITFGPPDEGG